MYRGSLQPLVRLAGVRRRLHWLLGLCLSGLCLSGLGLSVLGASDVAAQTAAPLDPRLMAQIQTLLDEKTARTPAQRKLDSRLVLGMKKRRGDRMFARLPRLQARLEMRGELTLVDLHGEVTPALESAIRKLGGRVVGSHPRWAELRAWVPVARLESLAARSDVQWLRPAERALTRVTTQGDIAHGSRVVREAFPQVNGSGVKVCVLSDGVSALSQVQAAGELPEVEIIGAREGETGTEGTAMLEIIHDIAPGAALGFATANGGQGQFADNILALRDAGCQIIVDDVGYATESPFQDGAIAFAIDMVAPRSALYFSAAGNSGQAGDGTVWEGDFNGVIAETPVGSLNVNDFGGSVFNPLRLDPRIGPTDPPFFTLAWSEPFAAAVSDYDLFLLDASRTMVLASSTSFQTQRGTRFALEAIDAEGLETAGGALMVALASGVPRAIRVETFDTRTKLAFATTGHIAGHPAALGADAVAAAAATSDPMNPFPAGIEFFSSDGPRRIFFTPFGTALTPNNFLFATGGGIERRKPDLTAADRVSTSTPTPDNRFRTFGGTSAAAPHAAAIAALIKSAAPPGLSNDKLRFVLKATARDLGPPGFDIESGAGSVDALSALLLASAGVPCFDGIDNDGDGTVDFPGDPGCASDAGMTESPACSDGADNDADGAVDFPGDPDCRSPSGGTECGMGAAQSMAVVPLLSYLARRRRRRADA